MVKRILVAYDGSPGAELAVNDLAHGGFDRYAKAKVLTVADVCLPLPATGDGNEVPEPPLVVAARKRVADALLDAKKIAIQGAVLLHQAFPEWEVDNGAKADSPAWGILAEAAAWRADLVVIGSHRHTPLGQFFLGSVSRKVAAEAACPVRVARPRTGPANQSARILIGLDGSPESIAAANAALQRNWPARTRVRLVVVNDRNSSRGDLASGQENSERFEDSIQALLESTRAKFAARNLVAHWEMLEGDPKTRLLEYAEDWNADNIFLGAHGVDHGGKRALGTLAAAICTRARCTVEIVRTPANAGS